MIISRTPTRISFVGGGSDLPAFSREHGGAVVSTTIDKWIRVCVLPRFDTDLRVSYSKTETVSSPNELQHELLREALLRTGVRRGVDVVTLADLPARGTGLGSSSALTVGALNALYSFIGDHRAAEDLAREASEIEINTLKKPIGKQDQYATAFGGLNLIEFHPSGDVYVHPIAASAEKVSRFHESLLLFYTGSSRGSDQILSRQQSLVSSGETVELTKKMRDSAYQMRDLIHAGDVERIGELLGENWELKREVAPGTSTPEIDQLYDRALEAGAKGGKLLGAGGGGFFLLSAPTESHASIRSALSSYREVPFRFTRQGAHMSMIERR